jgi:hypothetical protein
MTLCPPKTYDTTQPKTLCHITEDPILILVLLIGCGKTWFIRLTLCPQAVVVPGMLMTVMWSNSQASFVCPQSVHHSSRDTELVFFQTSAIARFVVLGVHI